MYLVKQITTSASYHLIGGVVATLVGILSQYLAQPSPDLVGIVFDHIVTLAIFGVGFFLLSSIGSAVVYQAMVKGQGSKGQPLERLTTQRPLTTRKFGFNYATLDIAGMFFAILLVFIVTILVQNGSGIPLGGFVGGWLIGGAFNQYRFSSKIAEEQIEQGRLFYFSDASIGPRTQISFYQVDPSKDRDQPQPITLESHPVQKLPNLVQPIKKTAVTRHSARIADPKPKTKAEPLVRTDKKKP